MDIGCKNCGDLWRLGTEGTLNDRTTSIQLKAEQLETAVALGCSLCLVLFETIMGLNIDHGAFQCASFHSSSNAGPLDMVVWLADGSTKSYELFTHPGEPAMWPVFGPARSVSVDSSSPSCLSLARDWLRECLKNHSECRAIAGNPQHTFLPHRVLKIDSKSNIVLLYEPKSKEQKAYTALSYCWGGSLQSKLKTTEATFLDKKSGINLQSLPLTLQHAITITTALGIHYLWVDSFCIIQDSVSDWQKESALMGEIYSNSTVTISADGAYDCDDGCFCESPYRNVTISNIPCPDPNGKSTKLYLRRAGFRQESNHSHATETLSRPRIDTRGWTLQERLLAPRILHFTSTELVWQCASKVFCECHVIDKEADNLFLEPFRAQYMTKNVEGLRSSRPESMRLLAPPRPHHGHRRHKSEQTEPHLQYFAHGTPWLNWRRVVAEYTQRNLTYEHDRLPAISGLAASITRRLPMAYPARNYYFGLWKADLFRNLLWHVISADDDLLGDDDTFNALRPRVSKRFDSTYGPSWSWASVTGRIAYYDEVCDEKARETELEPRIRLVDMIAKLHSDNPYGAGNAELVVAGDIIPVAIRLRSGNRYGVFKEESDWNDRDLGVATVDVWEDPQKVSMESKEFYWLVVAHIVSLGRSSVGNQGIRPLGLLLERLPDHSMQMYRRIGLVLGNLRTSAWNRLYESIRVADDRNRKNPSKGRNDALEQLTGQIAGPELDMFSPQAYIPISSRLVHII